MNNLKRWLACVLAFVLIIGNTLGNTNITYADVIGPSMEKIEDIIIPHPYSTTGIERFVVNEDISFSHWNTLTEGSKDFDSANMFDWRVSEKENSINPENKVYESENVGSDNSYAVAGMRFKNAAEITFDYKTSCEEPVANEETGESLLKDDFIVIVDDKIVLQAGGETDWTSFHYHVTEDGSISTEEHEIYWVYSKDASESAGEDCAFLSNVKVDGKSYELIEDVNAGISLLSSGEDGSTAEQEETTESTTEDTSATTEEITTEAANEDANAGIATVADGDVAMIVTQSRNGVLSSETKTYSYYPTLESALEAAKNGKDDEKNWSGTTYTKGRKRVILIDDANISTDLVIPSGVTLILPFNDGNGDSLEESADSSVAADVQAAWDSGNYLNHTLTVSENAKLSVNGKLIVAGVWGPKKQNAIQGLTCGSYSQIICNGDISIESGGTMEVYGLVTGEDGGITVKSGGSLTEPFLIADFPGGTILSSVKDQCFPLSQYGFNNVKSKIDIESGGVLIGKGKVYAVSMFTTASVIIVGDSDDDAFIKLNSNSSVRITHLEIDFNGNKNDEKVYGALGKTKFTVKGGANIGKLAMKIAFYISTQNKYLALPYTFDVELCTNENGEGTYNIDDGIYIKIMPGSKLTTQEGTSLNINGGRLVAYNGLIQKSKVCRSYPTNTQLNNWGESQSGELVVNGTLNINDEAIFAGIIQTDGLGNVNVSLSARLGVENFSDGFDLNDSNENIAYFNIPAKIWNGYSLENLEQGKYYSAYNGINSKVTKWNLEEFECITWSEGTTIHGTSDNGGNCTCTTNCTNNKYYVENEDNIKYTEPKIGAWNLTDIIYTADGDGYTIVPVEGNAKNPLPQGDTFKFKVVFDEGYSAGIGFAVKVNGTEIAGTDYEYSIKIDDTINNGQFPDQVITVEGVVDTPPTGTIETSINGTSYKWEEVSDTKDTIKSVATSDSAVMDDSIKFTITGKDTPDTSDYPVTIQYCVSESKLDDVTTYNQWKTYDAEKGVVIPTDCKVYVYAKITDTKPEGGNITYVSTPLIIVDNKGPVGTITVGDKSWTGKSEDAEDVYYKDAQNVSIKQSDNASDTVKDILYYKASSPVEDITAISNEEWITYKDGTPISIGNEADETCIIYAKMEDNVGHISYAATGVITVDKTEPTVTVLADDNTDMVDTEKATIYFNKESKVSKIVISANDNLAGVEKITYKVNGNETVVTGSEAEISISDGTYDIEITVTDKSGNEKTVTCKEIIVDTKAPTGSISLGSYQNEEGKTVLGDSWPKENTESTFYNKIYFETYKTSENIEVILNAQDDGPSKLSETIDYYISSSVIDDFSNVEWKKYNASASPTIALNTKQYIYVKLADHAGNETILLAEDIMVDTVSPTGSIAIKETDYLWETFLETISFGAISFKESKKAEIKGNDAESQISKISYMETANTYDAVSKLEAAVTGGSEEWQEDVLSTADNSVSFDYELTLNNEKQDRKVVVYAKVEDKSGNITYLSSDGIILDDTVPTATVIVGQAGDVWTKTNTDETVYYNSSYFAKYKTNENLELFLQSSDGEGSGITEKIEYILSETPVTNYETEEWSTYVNEDGKRPALEAGKPQYAYFRVIDNAGNVNIISVGKMFLDLTNPTGTIQLDNVETVWKEFLEEITFGLLSFNKEQNVMVEGTDIDSKISSVGYMESTNLYGSSTELEEAVADGIETWTVHGETADPCEIKETISIANNDKKVVVYIKLEDKAGNISYLSTNGIIMDATAPKTGMLIDEVSVVEDGVQTEGESDVLYYRLAKKIQITAEVNLAPIEKIETWVFPYTETDKTLDVNSQYYECHNWTVDNSVASRTLEANSDSVIYARITDKAGNITEIHSKQIIVDTTSPEGTLVFGDVTVSKDENDESTSGNVYFNASKCNGDNEVVLDLQVSDEGGSKLTGTTYFTTSNEELNVTEVENWEAYSDTNKPTIPENELTYVYAKVVDNAENTSYVISKPILLDTQLPEVQIDVVDGTDSWNTDHNEGISYYKGNELNLSIIGEDPLSEAGNGSGIASTEYRIKSVTEEENMVQMLAETEEDAWQLYTDSIQLEGNGKYKVEAKITDNAGNSKIVVTDTIVLDDVEPTAEVSIKENTWKEFLNSITFGLFFNETQKITVSAEDTCSGVEKIQYVVKNFILSENDVMALSDADWTTGESGKNEISFDVDPEQRFIVYVKVTDKSGNVEYISTNGIVLDITKPVIKYENLNIDSSVDESYIESESYGTENIKISIADTNLDKVALYQVIDENTKNLLDNSLAESEITIEPAESHYPYLIEATDKAGNVSTCQFYYLKPCTVSFDNFNGAGIETLSTKTDYKYGETIVQPEQTPQRNEDKIQYQFAGWMDDATEAKYPLVEKDNAAVVDLPVVSANSVRYTAYYEEIAYKVTIPDSKEGEFSINYTEEIHSGWMDKGDVVSFKIENLDAYNLCTFDVKVNGESIDAQPDGTYAVTVDKVMDITVTSVEHKYKDEIEKEATCTEAGGLKRTCNNCDRAPEYIYMPMSGHNFGDTEEIVKEPTCTNEGLKIGECSYCKQYAEEVIPANGHDYDLEHREVVTEETCTTSGLTAAACKNCDDIKFATIPASHVIVIDDAKPATCTEPGLTEGSHCSRCNDVLEPQKEITNPTGHHWSEWSIQEDSTCTKEGTKIRNCTKCGESETLTIEVRNHDYKDVVTNPTCTDDGYTTHTCLYEACGHSYVDTYVEANGHTWGDWNTEVQATCTKDGQKTRTCSVSGCNETETVTIKSQGHQYEDKVVEPTCTNEGYTLHVCKVCGDEYRTDTVPAVGHKWDNDNPDIISVETCTAPGVKVVTCTKCAITKNVVTKAKGHSYKEDVTVDPTCTEAGYTVEICENCKEERHVDEKAALGHEIKTSEAKAPTCTEIGWEAYEECARENCDYSTYKELPATGHTEVVTEGYDATCTQKGATDAISCSVCNTEIKKSVEIPAKGHILVVDKGYEATCTTKGLEDGKHCIICGAVTQEQDVIPALKHDWKTLPAKVVNPPTCENAGLEVETCSRCELTRSVVIDATGHNYKVTDTVEKTCTTDGYTEQTCKNCGYVTKTDVETAPGHDLVTIEAQAVGCTIIGWEKYEKCNNCDYTTYKEISPTGHREAARNGKAATCMNAGKTDEIYCSVCDAILKQAENIPPTGHKITIDKGYEATCTAKGLGDGKHCSVCDDVIQEQKVIEPLGHDWDTVNVSIVNQPTCTNAGLKIETCKRCGVTRTVVMEALGHNYKEAVVKPTCTETGYTKKTCDKCGDVQCENETAALNHDIESHEAQAATCEAIGWDAYETCKREGCGYSTYVEIPATGHTKVTEPAIDPTCTETGLTEKVYCSVCNEVLTAAEEIPAKGHVETTVSGINPTCTEPGKSEGKYCIVCGDVTVLQKEIPALKHAWDTENAKVAVKPTCQESGTNVETCTRCEITRTVVTDPTGHIYGTGVVTAPTCTKDGYTTFTCTNEGCGHTKQENPTEKLGHTETLDEAVAPTCEKDGLTEGSHCSVCNEVLTAQEVIPATKHTLGDWTVETAPTCEKTGEERRYCLNHKCNHYESREIVATGHNYKTEVTAPTCTEDGYTVYTCQNDNCGKVTKSDVVKATGHKYSAKVKDPTCESDGYTTFTCSICDDTYNDYFKDKTGHTVVTDEGKAATCTDTGLTEGSHCSTCGKVLEGQEITSALEHNYDNGVVVEATCEKDGYTLKTCTRCDYEEKTDTVKAQGHIWCDEAKAHVVTAPTCTTSGMTVFTCDNCSATKTEYPQPYGHNYEKQVTPPTCEEGGYTTYTCSRCQDSYKENEVDALGHDYVEYEGQDATCTAGGWKAYHVCTRCEDENYEAIEATGHSYKENVVEATCTARGYTTFECEHCEHTYTGNYVDATGHQMGDYEVTTAPTCTDKGVETSKCIHCDYEVTREVEKSGHKYSEEVTEPTCTVNGYTTYTCTVCKDSYVDDIVKATGHEEVTDDAVKASCTEDGLTKGSHCAACGSVIVAQEVIKATGHTEKVDHAVDATCEKDGATEGKHCSVCGEILIAQEVIPAFGHTYENSKTIINPTCDTAGLVLETCATCGDTRLGTLEQLQHEYVSQTTEPTCTEDGNTTYICKLCKNSYVDEVTKATGHNYQEEVTEPTCTDKGYTTYVCKVCQDTYKDNEVAAKGHTSVVDEGKDATCTETGLTDGSHCGTCSVVLTEQTIIPAKGHSYEADVVSATCTTAGHTDYECTRCKHSYSSDITKATGHTYVSSVTKEATESQNGILAFKCSGCQASYNRVIPADMNTWLVDRNTDSITINWNNVHPETNENIGYEIWFADQNGTFALQATVDEKVNEYTLSGLVSGSEYKVYVKAFSDVSGKKVYGENSNILTTVTVPAKAGGLKVSKTTISSFGVVEWTPVVNAQGYELYYKTTKASYYKLAQEIRGNIALGQITGLKANKTYNIKVRSYTYLNGTKVYGEYSDVLVATTKLKTPTIKLIAKSKKITIKWSRIPGAEGYKIYRATSKNGKYKLIKTIKGNKKVTYTNTKLKSGKKYYYKVRAYRVIAKKTRYSAYSKVKYKRAK